MAKNDIDPMVESRIREIVREILREEGVDYLQNASILPIKLRGSTRLGDPAADGDVLTWNANDQIAEWS